MREIFIPMGEKVEHICSYPRCRSLRRLSITADIGPKSGSLRLSACLSHEKDIMLALKALGYDAFAVLEPSPASSTPTRKDTP